MYQIATRIASKSVAYKKVCTTDKFLRTQLYGEYSDVFRETIITITVYPNSRFPIPMVRRATYSPTIIVPPAPISDPVSHHRSADQYFRISFIFLQEEFCTNIKAVLYFSS